jgi:hypothetical protein
MSEQIIRDVPTHHIILLFVNGFLILLLTPLSVYLSIGSILQSSASEAISRIVLIVIFSLAIGGPALLTKVQLIGNSGIVATLKGKKIEETEHSEDYYKQQVRFSMWTKNSGVEGYLSFMFVKYAIVNGAVIGSAIALFLDIFIFIPGYAVLTSNIPVFLIIQIIAAFFVFFFFYFFDKRVFRDDFNRAMGAVNKTYENEIHPSASNVETKKEK